MKTSALILLAALLIPIAFSLNLKGQFAVNHGMSPDGVLKSYMLSGSIQDENSDGRRDIGDVFIMVKKLLNTTENLTANSTLNISSEIEIPDEIKGIDFSAVIKNGRAFVEAGKSGNYTGLFKNGHLYKAYHGLNGKCNYRVVVDDSHLLGLYNSTDLKASVINGISDGWIKIEGCGLREKATSFVIGLAAKAGRLAMKLGLLK